jgi:hypothetical protein
MMATNTVSSVPAPRTRTHRLWNWLLDVVILLLLGFGFFQAILWPWMSAWGSTPTEQVQALPGDELVPTANIQTTKGLTIQATPAEIYPWLLQLGVDRGGMYSYDWLENLFGLNVHTVRSIMPEYQAAQVGDFWRFTPQDYPLNPGPGLWVKELRPNEAVLLCFGMENAREESCIDTWQLVLIPQGDGSTRLLLRSRMAMEQELLIKMTYFIQFLMERKMLLTFREMAEGQAGGA